MDKLKQYGVVLKKHHFWVLCGIVVLVAPIAWDMASRELQAKFTSESAKVKGTISNLQQYGPASPNEKYASGLNAEQTKLKTEVLEAWKIFSKDQREKLKWPAGVADIGKLKPEEEIPEQYRENYMRNIVGAEWQRLFEKVNLRRTKGGAPPPGPGEVNTKPVDYEGIVVWDAGHREELKRRYLRSDVPSSTRVRVTQEDLWVFESLIDIVSGMNAEATDPLNAVIKRIDTLEIAQWASLDAQQHPGAEIELKKEQASTGGMGMASSSGQEEGFVMLPGAGENKIGEHVLTADQALLNGRYLDEKSQPVPVDPALKAPPFIKPPFTEFNQMLVNMQFVMDQRKIPELLTACANSHLPIDARQVVMHFTDIDSVKAGGAEMMVAAPDAANRNERSPYDATVQIRGIVYIYNEPDLAKLGTGSAANPAHRSLGIPVPKAPEEPPPPAM
jgi:hypothetical protein